MARLYHLDAINERTGARVRMTAYPMPHAQCLTMRSKITDYPWRRVVLCEVPTP